MTTQSSWTEYSKFIQHNNNNKNWHSKEYNILIIKSHSAEREKKQLNLRLGQFHDIFSLGGVWSGSMKIGNAQTILIINSHVSRVIYPIETKANAGNLTNDDIRNFCLRVKYI
jgi:hypothetical protein